MNDQVKSDNPSSIPSEKVLDKLSKKQLLQLTHRLFMVNNDLVLRNAKLLEAAIALQQERNTLIAKLKTPLAVTAITLNEHKDG